MNAHFRNRRQFAPAIPPLFALAASILALVVAYVSQYGFGLHPCTLCYWQRIPYAVVIVFGILGFFLRHRRNSMPRLLLWLCVVGLLVAAALGAFHAGVEWRWWEGPGACSGAFDTSLSLDELRARILGAPTVSCQDAAVRIFGLSMAGWNAVYALTCMLILLFLLRRGAR